VPFDPEGLLGCLTSSAIVCFGIQAGLTLLTFQDWRARIKRWILWYTITEPIPQHTNIQLLKLTELLLAVCVYQTKKSQYVALNGVVLELAPGVEQFIQKLTETILGY
jgi:hypothetical protein